MIKKIIITVLIIFAALWFYKKYMASTFDPFFKQKSGKIDFIQKQVPVYPASKY